MYDLFHKIGIAISRYGHVFILLICLCLIVFYWLFAQDSLIKKQDYTLQLQHKQKITCHLQYQISMLKRLIQAVEENNIDMIDELSRSVLGHITANEIQIFVNNEKVRNTQYDIKQ